MLNNITKLLDNTTNKCKDTVINYVKHKNYKLQILNITTTTLISGHGPTLEYLYKRKIIPLDSYEICNIKADYTHITKKMHPIRRYKFLL